MTRLVNGRIVDERLPRMWSQANARMPVWVALNRMRHEVDALEAMGERLAEMERQQAAKGKSRR